MNNNDTLRKLRYAYDYTDLLIIRIFSQGDLEVSGEDVKAWLSRDDHALFMPLSDKQLAHFLNGFIVEHRGKKEGVTPVAEDTLNNNIILRKIKIALNKLLKTYFY